MALAFTLRADVATTANQSSYATSAFTPSASAGILVGVFSSKASAPDTPTLDSPSWLSGAWTQELTLVSTNDAMRLTVFSGRTVASPGSAALTADYGGVNQTGCIIQVVDVTGEDETDFVLQPEINNHPGGTSASDTLAGPLASAESACLAFIGHAANEVQTPTGGETELADSGHNTPTRRMSTQFEINDTTTGASWASNVVSQIAAMEIAAAAAVFVPRNPAINHQNPAFL